MGKLYWKSMGGYEEYLSEEAYELAVWAHETPERSLALKKKKIADKMEDKKRECVGQPRKSPTSNGKIMKFGNEAKSLNFYLLGKSLEKNTDEVV